MNGDIIEPYEFFLGPHLKFGKQEKYQPPPIKKKDGGDSDAIYTALPEIKTKNDM